MFKIINKKIKPFEIFFLCFVLWMPHLACSQSLIDEAKKQEEIERLRKMMEKDRKELAPKNPSETSFSIEDLQSRGQIFKCDNRELENSLNKKGLGEFFVMIDDEVVSTYTKRDHMGREIKGAYELTRVGKLVRQNGLIQFHKYYWMQAAYELIWEYEPSSKILASKGTGNLISSTCSLHKWLG